MPASARAEATPPSRRIWLCADDYGIAPGVSAAIRDLIASGRLNATSVMVVAPSCTPDEVAALQKLNDGKPRVGIGLHLTLTGRFRPLSANFAPLADGTFPSVGAMMMRSVFRMLDREKIRAEAQAQLSAFIAAFGRPPDFIDGHQHVHLFPQVRDAVIAAARQLAPSAWMRQCGSGRAALRWSEPKAMILDTFSRGFSHAARAAGVPVNPAFAGTYSFSADADFAALFPRFLDGLPAGSVVMCHPGLVDAELERLDPLTTLREREYAYLRGDAFPQVLAARGVTLG
jgi:predicted glycoside hydrolase/deacetylase ChbG (UPF0249 family)